MTWYEALLLGLLQGLAEFLPISSSGHLELAEWLLGVENSEDKRFAVVVHVATALATILTFNQSIAALLRGLFEFRRNDSLRYALLLAVSMVPILMVGLLFKKEIDSLFDGQITLVGCMFLLTAVLIVLAEKITWPHARPLTPLRALIIGAVQTVAILPGLSRSGATITTALLLGIDRSEAARFSFLMVLVPILGAGLLEVKELLDEPPADSVSLEALAIGFVASLGSGLLACRSMIALVRRRSLMGFAYYLVGLGSLTLLLLVLRG